jgi:anti-anti-sigma factor
MTVSPFLLRPFDSGLVSPPDGTAVSIGRLTVVPTFRVDVSIEPGQAPVLVLAGELDYAAAPAITAAAAQLLQAAAHATRPVEPTSDLDDHLLVVRLAEVTFFDCAALGALVGLQTQLARAGGTLLLQEAGPPVLRLLAVTRGTHHLQTGR